MSNWTEKHSRYYLLNLSISIMDEILEEIAKDINQKIVKNRINKENIKNLYRPTIHLSTSIFLERFIRIFEKEENLTNLNFEKKKFIIVKNSLDCFLNNYYDKKTNENLLYNLSIVLKKKYHINNNFRKKNIFIKKKFYYENNLQIKRFIEIFQKIIDILLKKISIDTNKKIITDGTVFLDFLSSESRKFYNHKANNNINYNISYRNNLQKIIKNIFLKKLSNNNKIQIKDKILHNLSTLFSEWTNANIPRLLLEDLDSKIKFYSKKYNLKTLNEIHATTSLLFDDNFKIFTALCKTYEKPIIVHDHGVNNFIKYFDKNYSYKFAKMMPLMFFSDYYLAWGMGPKVNQWDKVEEKFNTKILNFGSNYLMRIKNKKNYSIPQNDKLKIFYPSSPFKFYMTCLDEITPEENLIHKIKIAEFIEKIINEYDLEFVYKNFDSKFINYKDDPIINYLDKYLQNGKIKITNRKPIEIMKEFDLLLLDMVSTTFAESVSMGVPSLIFSNKFDYSILCNDGKIINDKLEKNKILFYDKDVAVENFKYFITNKKSYFSNNRDLFIDYQKKIAYPVLTEEFKLKLNSLRYKFI